MLKVNLTNKEAGLFYCQATSQHPNTPRNVCKTEVRLTSKGNFKDDPVLYIYKFDRKGIEVKSVRDSLGITSTRLGPTEFL